MGLITAVVVLMDTYAPVGSVYFTLPYGPVVIKQIPLSRCLPMFSCCTI